MKQLKRTKRARIRLSIAARRLRRRLKRPRANGRRHFARKPRVIPGHTSRQKLEVDAKYQAALKHFEAGVRLFQKQHYAKALEVFKKLESTSPAAIADRARLYLRLCEQRRVRSAPSPRSAADFYDLGVAALNARDFDSALQYLTKANKLEPDNADTRYALAVANALLGQTPAALAILKSALALRPGLRIQAARDEDFQSLASDPEFQNLVRSEAS